MDLVLIIQVEFEQMVNINLPLLFLMLKDF